MSKPSKWMLVILPLLVLFGSAGARANPPNVVVSIKPLHALVSAVMDGIGEPELLIDGLTSPHTFTLKPSMATRLQAADLVFWIGPDLETSLENSLLNLAEGAEIIGFEQFESGLGPHIWLDPQVAVLMVDDIMRALVSFDPENAKYYNENAESYQNEIKDMQARIAQDLTSFQTRPIILFHDAYAHFQTRFALNIVGIISASENQRPGPRQIRKIRDLIAQLNVACVFSEPQFDQKSVTLVIEGTTARGHELDPLGADLPAGPAQYIQLMENIAKALSNCLNS